MYLLGRAIADVAILPIIEMCNYCRLLYADDIGHISP
jgi:hypothetical protein